MTALISVARITEREERSRVCTPIPKRSGAFKAVRAGSESRRIWEKAKVAIFRTIPARTTDPIRGASA